MQVLRVQELINKGKGNKILPTGTVVQVKGKENFYVDLRILQRMIAY